MLTFFLRSWYANAAKQSAAVAISAHVMVVSPGHGSHSPPWR